MIKHFRGALCASFFFSGVAFSSQSLVGLAWTTSEELAAIAALDGPVRYVTRGVVFVQGDVENIAQFEVLFVDKAESGDRYFIADHLRLPLPTNVELVFAGGGEWVLLRVPEGEVEGLYDATYFFWPLPNKHSINGWLGVSRSARKALQMASPAVALLIEAAEVERLRADVEALALKDPSLGSVAGNVRSRFAVHPELLESTEYIRVQLAEIGRAHV